MTARFDIGSSAWVASYGNEYERQTCPVCFGKLSVVLILGNGERVTTECEYCGKGYDGPQGFVSEYVERGRVDCHTVTYRECQEDAEGKHWTYRGGVYVFYDHNAFLTREEAEARAAELAADHKREEATRAEHIKHCVHKSFSWNVGYHRRQVQELTRRAEYHAQKARLCQERTTKGGPNP